jgi:drug/metabolite transporter (DMT)-like permease
VLLGEAPSALQLVGVALVVGGIAVATLPLARLRGALAAPTPSP